MIFFTSTKNVYGDWKEAIFELDPRFDPFAEQITLFLHGYLELVSGELIAWGEGLETKQLAVEEAVWFTPYGLLSADLTVFVAMGPDLCRLLYARDRERRAMTDEHTMTDVQKKFKLVFEALPGWGTL